MLCFTMGSAVLLSVIMLSVLVWCSYDIVMLFVIMQSCIIWNVFMLGVLISHSECQYANLCYAECLKAVCHHSDYYDVHCC